MVTRVKLVGMGLILSLSVALAAARGHPWHWLVCTALGFSWLGDAMLAHYPPVAGRVRDPFIAGMGFFALAQIMYILAFRQSLAGMPLLRMRLPGAPIGLEVIGAVLPVYVLAAAAFWVFVVLRAERSWTLKIAAFAYSVLLSAMAAFACAAAFTGASFAWPLLLGGTLFLVSDAAISLRIFMDRLSRERTYQWVVWGTYIPAQLCLLIGASMLY